MDSWLQTWKARADGARDGEPETAAYEACTFKRMVSLTTNQAGEISAGKASEKVEKPNEVLIFERYTNGRKSMEEHLAHPSHATLQQVMAEKKMTKRVTMTGLVFKDGF